VVFPLVCSLYSIAQNTREAVAYIVDSIPIMEDPDEENQVTEADVADITVIKNRDSLNALGYDKFAGAIFIFTKAYRTRSDDVKNLPSLKQMERKNGTWYFHDNPYTGKFINYYYSGRKQAEGTFQNGKAGGLQTTYYPNGVVSTENYYVNGVQNGTEKEYYENGAIKQKGEFVNGKEEGVWEMYFPNGQVKQRNSFRDGTMDGETTIYYSSGKVLAVEIAKNGKITADKRLEKIRQMMNKGHASYKEGDYKAAIKNYSKAIDLDSTYAEAYFARGTIELNDFQFDEAILDFNKALGFEPYLERALSNRAFARIRKYQLGSGRKLSENRDVTVIASKDVPGIPANERAIICADLKQAMSLGNKGKTILDAWREFCGGQ